MKKSHILSYTHETLVPLEVINIPKFYEDRTKNVDFLLMANFWKCLIIFPQTLVLLVLSLKKDGQVPIMLT